METLVRGAVENAGSIDKLISDKSENWRIGADAGGGPQHSAPGGLRNERPENARGGSDRRSAGLARQFSGDESVAFINGVLDAVSREQMNLFA